MDIVLRDLVGNDSYVFTDDIIFGNTIEEHASRIGHALERFDWVNLQFKQSKCEFAQPQVEYLGYVVSRDGIRASPEKTRTLKNFPFLETRKKCGRSWDSLPSTRG